MSLFLTNAKPEPISAALFIDRQGVGVVSLGGTDISLDEFRCLVMYVLCNADIVSDKDPRLELLEDVRSLVQIIDLTLPDAAFPDSDLLLKSSLIVGKVRR